jgi:transposase-like protein
MTQNGPRRRRRQLSPAEKWEVFLEVVSQQFSQADAARKWGVDVSTVIKLAKDGALAAFAASRPGRPSSSRLRSSARRTPGSRSAEGARGRGDGGTTRSRRVGTELTPVFGDERASVQPPPDAR